MKLKWPDKPDRFRETDVRPLKSKRPKKKQPRKEGLFLKLINKVLKLEHLKMFEIALGWVKGMSLKIEFFEMKREKK